MAARPAPPSLLFPKPRRSPWGGIGAILLHLLLIGAVVVANWREVLSWTPVTELGDRSKERGGGGGGGGSIREVALPPLEKPAAPQVEAAKPPPLPPPEPVAEPEPTVTIPPPAEPVMAVTAVDSAGKSAGQGGPGTGGGKGTGTGTGQGSGTGPGSGSGRGPGTGGEGGRGVPPEPRQVILPPLDYPRDLRGQSVAVTFWVSAQGRVERVALEPEIDDRGFAKKFAEVMRNYRFKPARSADGIAIAGVTTVTITF